MLFEDPDGIRLEVDHVPGKGPLPSLLADRKVAEYPRGVRPERLTGRELEGYLQQVTAAVVDALAPERVVLFGSFARGDQNRASDLDLVVIAPTSLPFCERIGRVLACCEAVSRRLPVEALVYTPEEWERMVAAGSSFAGVVLREGRVLYDRQSQPDRGAAVAQAGVA